MPRALDALVLGTMISAGCARPAPRPPTLADARVTVDLDGRASVGTRPIRVSVSVVYRMVETAIGDGYRDLTGVAVIRNLTGLPWRDVTVDLVDGATRLGGATATRVSSSPADGVTVVFLHISRLAVAMEQGPDPDDPTRTLWWVRFTNHTGQALPAGVLDLYAADRFLSEAPAPAMAPGREVVVPYARSAAR